MGWNTPPNHFRPIQVISEKRIVLCKTRTGKHVPQSAVSEEQSPPERPIQFGAEGLHLVEC